MVSTLAPAAPAVRFDSHVECPVFSRRLAWLWFPDTRGPAGGDPRPLTPARRSTKIAQKAPALGSSRSSAVDLALPCMPGVAQAPRDRQAGDRDCLAQKGLPTLLDMEKPPRTAGDLC